MVPEELMSITSHGGFLLAKVHYLSQRILAKKLKAQGITEFSPAQGRIVFALWEGDGITITQLARRTALEKSTLTRMLDRMEKSQMIHREYPSEDRRTVRIILTPHIRHMLTDIANVSTQMATLFYRGFTDQEIQIFELSLQRIIDNLDSQR